MKTRGDIAVCDREAAVETAVRLDRWSDELRSHAASCDVCRDVVAVGQFLRREADEAFAGPMPDAELIWWKAQLMARQEAARRAARPIAFVESAACACGLLVVAAAAVWAGPVLFGEASGAFLSFVKVMGSGAMVGPLAGLSLAALSLYLLISLRSLTRPAKR